MLLIWQVPRGKFPCVLFVSETEIPALLVEPLSGDTLERVLVIYVLASCVVTPVDCPSRSAAVSDVG